MLTIVCTECKDSWNIDNKKDKHLIIDDIVTCYACSEKPREVLE